MNKIFVCQIDELDEGEALKVECGINGIEALAVFAAFCVGPASGADA